MRTNACLGATLRNFLLLSDLEVKAEPGRIRIRISGEALRGLGGALGRSGGALEELCEALYIEKLLINRAAAVMLMY